MIAHVRGRVAALAPDSAVVEVGGVGVLVHCAPGTLAALRVGEEATLATSLIVREDSLTLYGFADADERAVFEILQTATGVGPKVAQAVLAVHGPDDVRRAVATDDVDALCLVPGIGKKGAQRIVIELKDRLGAPERVSSRAARATVVPPTWQVQLRDALLGLGYSTREADEGVLAVTPADGETVELPVLLREALAVLRR
ncbi:MAG TPA: Holliday junction branch migration protein RuvA [Mycobacteriales bacterium]|nr:Holliday junction branch migration protein RuvA [Mycobacteriales bacterium]